ncbi:unnamed protein product [Microthlaspi erraticum]|uniref:Uncharacterized protein n=1 Tax=Microthlaspi erraticum TaxID=1685480 RepID=A0A6D2K273_9BRAS|nr:unnamed protein product [Microthlaspi erraticum]
MKWLNCNASSCKDQVTSGLMLVLSSVSVMLLTAAKSNRLLSVMILSSSVLLLYFDKLFLPLLSALSALALLGKMMKLGYEPSIVTLSRFSMVSVTGIGSLMQSLLDQMVEMGYKPDIVAFTTLIHGLFLHNKV